VVDAGVDVQHFNHRDIAGVLRMVRVLGSLTGKEAAAQTLAATLQATIDDAAAESAANDAAGLPRPLVYFEEWPDPIITGIGWVGELIELAGGRDAYAEHAPFVRAKQRIVADPLSVAARAPDLIVGSWCGKRFRPETVLERDGWQDVPAVKNAERGHIIEIKSADILAPGPTLLTRGLPQLQALIRQWHADRAAGALA
jgi:iron complex transport system substrate-binding protein